jgi:hypothetical protein
MNTKKAKRVGTIQISLSYNVLRINREVGEIPEKDERIKDGKT